MKKFLYKGDMTTLTIDKKDYVLHKNIEVELPETNDKVKTYQRRGLLEAIPTKEVKQQKGNK